MAQKKCPKCGEDNPAEAVMCWACYTPLTGGAAAAAGPAAARGPGGPPGPGPMGAGEDGEKKKLNLDPKVIGVVAFLLIGGGIGIMSMTGMIGGGGGGDDSSSSDNGSKSPATTTAAASAPAAPVGPGAAPSFTGGSVPVPAALPYTTVVPPNPKYATGTLGIVPTNTAITGIQAASLARFARDQYVHGGKYSGMQIVVFTDVNSARQFAEFQARKRGSPLQVSDYKAMADADLWRNAPAYYQSSGKTERVDYPSKNPYSWWQSMS